MNDEARMTNGEINPSDDSAIRHPLAAPKLGEGGSFVLLFL
jgi:hypothetical protein